jgi:HEAT repeat protein
MKLKLPTAHCLLLTAHCLLAAAARAELNKDILLNEAELIKVIQKADTSDNDVVTACQNLGWCGTKAAVAPLAALLASDKPHLRHAARYGLEMIPDPAAVAALCDAAGRLSGPALAGVLQSLGNRGNARAVDLLAKRAADPDKAVAAAAVQALGKLATPAAMAALKAALGTCPCVAEAYLDGAGRLAAADPAKAAACYADLRNTRANVAPAVRLAALLGEAVTAGDAGLELWEKAVADADADTVEAALRAVLDAQPGNRETLAFAKALAAVPAAQARLATLLGQRGDKAAVPALAALAARYAGHAEEPAFTVTSAVYGDPDGKQAKDITAQLQALVDNGAAAIKAGNHIAGDPAPNVPKVLRLVYTAGGVEKRVTLAENQTLAMARPPPPAAAPPPPRPPARRPPPPPPPAPAARPGAASGGWEKEF